MSEFRSFIESQFPVSKISKESYKERKANYSQTLTGLGKWWGRKPLILVRATILGLLMPASADPEKDRQIFLKILTMDNAGLWLRKSKAIPLKIVWERLTPNERLTWFTKDSEPSRPKFKKDRKERRDELQDLVFSRFNYDEKLEYCDRPEQIEGPSSESWSAINQHLGTKAITLSELIAELGSRQFGHIPKVGDAFCGGGSIPFEAARIGCEAYGADLSPVAAILTWSALNIIGGGPNVAQQLRAAQSKVYEAADREIFEWGIEHNKQGHRADAFLYCTETRCPERNCGWMVPLAPSWVIGEKTKTIAKLIPNSERKNFRIEILSGVSDEEMRAAKEAGTVKDSDIVCPNHPNQKTSLAAIRGDRKEDGGAKYGLRMWENSDVAPRPDDTFQERLYCIRWVETWIDKDGKEQSQRYYESVGPDDLDREEKVLALLSERFKDWQSAGYIPNRKIDPGDKTDEPIRTRGWTHWHHLFNPRQLLTHGLLVELTSKLQNQTEAISCLLSVGKCLDRGTKLCIWDSSPANEKVANTFLNQALNPLMNYGVRGFSALASAWFLDTPEIVKLPYNGAIEPKDVRKVTQPSDLWITDPPYADAVNYHELSEFFLASYEGVLSKWFPTWTLDSKRALAISGKDERFRQNMVAAYHHLASLTAERGAQIVMFTHQDAGVWADLALILWASGLRVTAAWCIATETDIAYKEGNFVQGTVLLVLRKQNLNQSIFLDEIIPAVEIEVKNQLDSMLALDDKEDPNFSDTDYQLAAYAAALRVLTKYSSVEDIDVNHELSKIRIRGETSQIGAVIAAAVKTACDHLVPKGFDPFIWKTLSPEERFYLKGLDLESHSEFRTSAYMELARGFGVRDYKTLLSSGKANQTRLKTASEFAAKNLKEGAFGNSLVRYALFAIREAVARNSPDSGRNFLKNDIPNYWSHRKSLIEILNYLATMEMKAETWKDDGHAAVLVAGMLANDSA